MAVNLLPAYTPVVSASFPAFDNESPLGALQDLWEAAMEAGLWSGEFNLTPLRATLRLVSELDFLDSSAECTCGSSVLSEDDDDSDSLWLSFE